MRYTDPEHTAVRTDDGRLIPAVAGNRDWEALVASGTIIVAYAPPPVTADDVRREASRRMQAVVGARDAAHLSVIIANGSRESIRLLRKGADNWSADEVTRAAILGQVDSIFEAIRAASDAMEASPPADYRANSRWP